MYVVRYFTILQVLFAKSLPDKRINGAHLYTLDFLQENKKKSEKTENDKYLAMNIIIF